MKKQLNSKENFNLNSNFWFWPILAGGFFGIGYYITKNLYLSKIHIEPSINLFHATQESLENKNQPAKDKIMKKIIYLPTYKDSNLKLTVKYSQVQNLKNQAIFKHNQDFYGKETVKTLTKTLRNTKKPKSSKVEAD